MGLVLAGPDLSLCCPCEVSVFSALSATIWSLGRAWHRYLRDVEPLGSFLQVPGHQPASLIDQTSAKDLGSAGQYLSRAGRPLGRLSQYRLEDKD